jgi:hypothetical protein
MSSYVNDFLLFVNLSTLRPKGRGLTSTRAQAAGVEIHPEP